MAPQEKMSLSQQPIVVPTKERIVIALDVDSSDKARSLIGEIGDSVGAFKIGLQLFTSAGPSFVGEMVNAGHRVFLDLKFHDIPNTVARAAVEATRLGVWMFTVHSLGGSEMMKRCAEAVVEASEREAIAKPKLVGVTVLTSSTANELSEVGIESDVKEEVVKLAQIAAQCGLDGAVASAHEAADIKTAVPGTFLVVTPGVRLPSATFDDQKRVMTPAEAVRSGSDFLVIGRPVTAARDKRAAVEQIINNIESIS